MTIDEASTDLHNHFGGTSNHPEWLSCIGINESKIFVYLNGTENPHKDLKSWENFPIVFKENSGFDIGNHGPPFGTVKPLEEIEKVPEFKSEEEELAYLLKWREHFGNY